MSTSASRIDLASDQCWWRLSVAERGRSTGNGEVLAFESTAGAMTRSGEPTRLDGVEVKVSLDGDQAAAAVPRPSRSSRRHADAPCELFR
jgi:hypothetical protein